jgi:lipoate-protein ligase B
MIDDIFSMTSDVLSMWSLPGTDTENALLGLWKGNKKLASMGIAIDKLTTYHGMALNFYSDREMKKALKALNPCGLNPDTYSSVEDFVFLPEGSLERFTVDFMRKVQDVWE